jgi:hypothetical protein
MLNNGGRKRIPKKLHVFGLMVSFTSKQFDVAHGKLIIKGGCCTLTSANELLLFIVCLRMTYTFN